MKAAMAGLLVSLAFALHVAYAQTTYDIADCADLQAIPEVVEATVLDFTQSPISCDSNHNTVVDGGTLLSLTSSLDSVELVNVRFELDGGSSLVVAIPNLKWQSTETDENTSGAALNVCRRCTATFEEDVTFSGCSVYPDEFGPLGGAIATKGTLAFAKTATFSGTVEGGAIFNQGTITFAGDAVFEDNYNANDYNYGGAGINNDGGKVTFEAAASFIGNEVLGKQLFESEGVLYQGGKGAGFMHNSYEEGVMLLFQGPALFSGNKGLRGGALYVSADYDGSVVFEDMVTFEDNVGMSDGDGSRGGAMLVDDGTVEFKGGMVATGNAAKDGGAFYISDSSTVNMDGDVTMSGNEGRYSGGAILNEGSVTMPLTAGISGNTAIVCPGIQNGDKESVFASFAGIIRDTSAGSVEFTGGSIYSGPSKDMCYLGEDTTILDDDPIVMLDLAAADCDAFLAAATTIGAYSFWTWDTRLMSEVFFNVGTAEFELSCATQLVIAVTGGGEITVASSADSLILSNIRFEVVGHSDLYFDVPKVTMTGIDKSTLGGSNFVDKDSSLEYWGDVKFLHNTLAYISDGAWRERGGAALYSAGLVMFRGQAYFRGNGLYESDGRYTWNEAGGAVTNIGSIEFVGKAKFRDSFNPNGGNGGGLANGGNVWFNKRTIWRNNTVGVTYTDDGENYNGHGAALYNFGPTATTTFYSKALFKDNIGGFRGCAVGANGGMVLENNSDAIFADGDNKITFEHKAFFKDNVCNTGTQDTGGAGLWLYGDATVEFQDRAVFRRNYAYNGGAIMNGGGTLTFISADLIYMDANEGTESCPDIKNYDKDLADHQESFFGDINNPDEDCGNGRGESVCTWYLGEVTIGGEETIVGEAAAICEFS